MGSFSSDSQNLFSIVISKIATATPLEETLREILMVLEKNDPAMETKITLIEEEVLGKSVSPKLPSFFCKVFEGADIGLNSCSEGRVAYSKKSLFIDDINADPSWLEYREVVGSSGLKTCLVEPIISSYGEICGVLSIFYRKSCSDDISQQGIFKQATQLASIILERHVLEKKLSKSKSKIRTLEADLVSREKQLQKNLILEKHQFLKSFIHDVRVPLNSILGFTKMLSISGLDSKHQEIVLEIENASNRLLEISNESAASTHPEFVVDKRKTNHSEKTSELELVTNKGNAKHEQKNSVSVITEVDVIDYSVLEFSTGFDRKTHSHLMKVFLSSVHETMNKLNIAIEDASFTEIEFSAHKLNSAAKSIGAKNFAHTSSLLEQEVSDKNRKSISQLYEELSNEILRLEDFVSEFTGEELVENSDDKKPRNIQSLEILVVDDDIFIIEQMRAVLTRMGVKGITTAGSGEKALEILQNNSKIDIVICDLNMPEMNGIEFFKHMGEINFPGGLILSSSEENRLIEAVGVAANTKNINVLGALNKPLSPQSLYNLLEKNKQHFSKTDKMLVEDVTLNELHNAIFSQQFIVYYQPQIEMKTRKVVGAEAVVRWLRPKRGLLPPDLFIYLAEENNLINELTQEVFEQAMNQSVQWHGMGYDFDLSLNLSANSIQREDLKEWLINVAAKTGLSADRVTLALKEEKLLENVLSNDELMDNLKTTGYRYALDDFGAGIANPVELQDVPFKELKIKRAYVSAAPNDEACQAIVESSIALAKIYKVKSVAKGVDTQEQWDLLEKLGCDIVQGYYVSKPMPADKFSLWLKNRK